MSDDILADLKNWHDHLVDEAPLRRKMGQMPDVEIDKLEHAIAEIERLRKLRKICGDHYGAHPGRRFLAAGVGLSAPRGIAAARLNETQDLRSISFRLAGQ